MTAVWLTTLWIVYSSGAVDLYAQKDVMSNYELPSMILESIKTFFTSKVSPDTDTKPGEHALHLATAMLLLEVSRADFDLGAEELKVVIDSLKSRFFFSDEDAQQLLSLALAQDQDTVSMHPFLRLINEHFSVAQKGQIIEDLWRVAFADHTLDKYEEGRIRKIADLLYLPHKEFIRAKLRVQKAAD